MSRAGRLAAGIAALGLRVPGEAQQSLLAFLSLLVKWNATYNLTAVRDPDRMLTHHLLDSLAVIPHLPGGTWLDVGSGAGVPGIVLALASTNSSVTLVERSQKKAAFLRQAVMELGVRNAAVVCERVEAWQTQQRFDVVISRALADLSTFVELAGHLAGPAGLIAGMKGAYPHGELARLPASWRPQAVIPLDVPGLNAARHLVLLQRA